MVIIWVNYGSPLNLLLLNVRVITGFILYKRAFCLGMRCGFCSTILGIFSVHLLAFEWHYGVPLSIAPCGLYQFSIPHFIVKRFLL